MTGGALRSCLLLSAATDHCPSPHHTATSSIPVTVPGLLLHRVWALGAALIIFTSFALFRVGTSDPGKHTPHPTRNLMPGIHVSLTDWVPRVLFHTTHTMHFTSK